MSTLNLSAIVEGHGDVRAVPCLLRRIQQAVRPDLNLNVLRPWRVDRYKLVKPGEIERTVELAARKTPPPRAILILVDADDDPPCVLGPRLLARAGKARPDVPIGVVLAKREYEAWFLAAIDSISGRRGLRARRCVDSTTGVGPGCKGRSDEIHDGDSRILRGPRSAGPDRLVRYGACEGTIRFVRQMLARGCPASRVGFRPLGDTESAQIPRPDAGGGTQQGSTIERAGWARRFAR